MGVFIYPCKIIEKVSNLESDEDARINILKEDIVILENPSKYEDFISPFEEGVYTYESGDTNISISYSTYGDFLQQLEKMQEVVNNDCAYSTTISACGIENCISYKVAEEMLEEFKQYETQVKKHLLTKENDEYSLFLWAIYEQFMEVLEESIELKGIVKFC